uniref:excalibur calcium-binding protein n=1 Tax=Streptomyces venezuelae TaxID=54571 RepID=UPI001F3605C5
MSSRSMVAGIALAIVSVAPLSGVAHAQDLDCVDFRYQEDAQAEFNRDTRDPHRLDEDQGPDDQIACERLPRRSDVNPVPVNPSPTTVPTRAVGHDRSGPRDRRRAVRYPPAAAALMARVRPNARLRSDG